MNIVEVKDKNTEDIQEIKNMLAPNFGYLPLFSKFRTRDGISLTRTKRIIELMKTYRQLLSARKINPLTFDNFESLDDTINRAIIHNEDLKFAKSFISRKYAFLLDDESVSLFGELRSFERSHAKVQSVLAVKMAAFKEPDHLKTALKQVINSYAGKFDSDTKEVEVIEKGGRVVFKSKNELIAQVANFDACKALGSSSWCISRERSYFNHYASKYNRQYIYWDFRKDRSNRDSQIGITVNISNSVIACHDKFDGSVFSSQYQSIAKNIPTVSRVDVLDIIKRGLKLSHEIKARFNITREEIQELNPYYFLTIKDVPNADLVEYIRNTKNIKSISYRERLESMLPYNFRNCGFNNIPADEKLLIVDCLNAKSVINDVTIYSKLRPQDIARLTDKFTFTSLVPIIHKCYMDECNMLDGEYRTMSNNVNVDNPEYTQSATKLLSIIDRYLPILNDKRSVTASDIYSNIYHLKRNVNIPMIDFILIMLDKLKSIGFDISGTVDASSFKMMKVLNTLVSVNDNKWAISPDCIINNIDAIMDNIMFFGALIPRFLPNYKIEKLITKKITSNNILNFSKLFQSYKEYSGILSEYVKKADDIEVKTLKSFIKSTNESNVLFSIFRHSVEKDNYELFKYIITSKSNIFSAVGGMSKVKTSNIFEKANLKMLIYYIDKVILFDRGYIYRDSDSQLSKSIVNHIKNIMSQAKVELSSLPPRIRNLKQLQPPVEDLKLTKTF